MAYRKILVPVIGDDRDRPALQAALQVARDYDGHAVAVFVHPTPADSLPSIGFGYTGPALETVIEAAMREADRKASSARKTFDQATREAALPVVKAPGAQQVGTADFRTMHGRFADRVEVASRLCDLVVAQAFSAKDGLSLRAAVEATVLSGRPNLIVPEGTPKRFGERVAVAFDGSPAVSCQSQVG